MGKCFLTNFFNPPTTRSSVILCQILLCILTNILKAELISEIVFEETRAVKHVFWSNRNIGLLIILKLKIIILHHPQPAAWELSQLIYFKLFKSFQTIQKIFRNVSWEFPDLVMVLIMFLLVSTSYTWSCGSLKNWILYLCLATCEWLWLLIRIFNSFLFNIFIASEMQVAWFSGAGQTKNFEIHLSKWSRRIW